MQGHQGSLQLEFYPRFCPRRFWVASSLPLEVDLFWKNKGSKASYRQVEDSRE
uniref:Uncharacterized protein n=1 Tax=Pyrococcus abyssi TaxID=29292 RepID=A0A5J6XUV5_PYRAY|nr:hypothetical protein [Pyrococcus abyssi]